MNAFLVKLYYKKNIYIRPQSTILEIFFSEKSFLYLCSIYKRQHFLIYFLFGIFEMWMYERLNPLPSPIVYAPVNNLYYFNGYNTDDILSFIAYNTAH